MKVTFRCKRSGNTVSFTNEDDIKQLRSHEGYEEIKDDTKENANCTNDESPKESIIDSSDQGKTKAYERNDEGRYDEGQKGSVLKPSAIKKRGRPSKK